MKTPAASPEVQLGPPDFAYIRRRSFLFNFLANYYWRVETTGLEHLPREGRAILVGNHRGFIPFDAIMVLHLIQRHTGRVPRFLVHPGLLKFRPIARFVTRMGGVLACRENAERALAADEILGVLPEGVAGAFSLHRNAYQLQSFGRDDFIKMALRHRAPIVPFVIVGSADALPIFARIQSRWWRRHMQWPYLPISTFPFLPAPLPSKWHVQILPPLHVYRQYPPESASNRALVSSISRQVREEMQQALNQIVSRRRCIFWGSAF
ncbi:MAG TPA: lysophospholipid acyltransferase family protein [Candidatus Angelobacter sp.]|nr:lysophospholipid acyltransferase family protein [Candidatus Angelobacter sp.]